MGKKQEIIQMATRLFLVDGFEGVSMNDIVKVTGTSKGGIYNYFASKENLFLAVVENILNHHTQFRTQNLLTHQFPTFKAFYTAYVNLIFDTLTRVKAGNIFMLFYDAIKISSDLSEKIDTVQEEAVLAFVNQIEVAKKNGEINSSTDAQAIAKLFMSLKEGVSADYILAMYTVDQARDQLMTHYDTIYQLLKV